MPWRRRRGLGERDQGQHSLPELPGALAGGWETGWGAPLKHSLHHPSHSIPLLCSSPVHSPAVSPPKLPSDLPLPDLPVTALRALKLPSRGGKGGTAPLPQPTQALLWSHRCLTHAAPSRHLLPQLPMVPGPHAGPSTPGHSPPVLPGHGLPRPQRPQLSLARPPPVRAPGLWAPLDAAAPEPSGTGGERGGDSSRVD